MIRQFVLYLAAIALALQSTGASFAGMPPNAAGALLLYCTSPGLINAEKAQTAHMAEWLAALGQEDSPADDHHNGPHCPLCLTSQAVLLSTDSPPNPNYALAGSTWGKPEGLAGLFAPRGPPVGATGPPHTLVM